MVKKKLFRQAAAALVSLTLVVTSLNILPNQVRAGVLSSEQNSGGWKLVWSDEFDQTVGGGVDTNTWTYQTGHGSDGWGNQEVQNYTDSTENVYITNADGATDGKALAIRAKRDYEGGEITSGRLMSEGKFYARYGRMEARIRMENGMQNGVWPAFWMMGNQTGYGWPNCGEIDIMEHRNKESEVISTLHWNPSPTEYQHSYYGSEINGQYGYVSTMDEWHTFRADWYENEIQFFLDGQWYESIDITSGELEEFQRAHYFLLNLAIGSNASPFTKGITVDSDWRSSTMYVDYVRVYQGDDANFQRNKTNRTENLPEPEVTTPVPDGFTDCVENENVSLGQWNYYFGTSWANARGSYKGGDALDNFSLKIKSKSTQDWGIQAYTNEMDVEKGSTYRYRINVNANQNTGEVLLKNDITADEFPSGEDLQRKGIVAGDNVYEGTFTAYADKVKFMFNLSNADAGTVLNFNSFTLEKVGTSQESTKEPEPTVPQPTSPVETTTSKADVTGYDQLDWLGDGARGGALNEMFKAYFVSGENTGIVNIQQKDDIAGIYVTLSDAMIGDIKVNGEKKDEIIVGAGVWVNIEHLTKRDNEVIFYNPDGSVKAVLHILNASIPEGGDTPTNPPTETTSKAPETTPKETTTKAPVTVPKETTTKAPETTPKETTTKAPTTVPKETTTKAPTTVPKETTTKAPTTVPKETTTKAPVTVPKETTTKAPETTPKETTTKTPEPTPTETKAPDASTEMPTADAQTETSAQATSQTPNVSTQPEDANVSKPAVTEGGSPADFQKAGKVKVKKITKKKSAKKVKIRLKKKAKNATGYQICFYKTKKSAKKNKKAVAKVLYKKNKKQFTVKSKKIKNKKKLFVRVRSYIVIDGKKQFSGWSLVKKIRIKK